MKPRFLFILLIALVLNSNYSVAQHYDGMRGVSTFKKYDNGYISPDMRGKHSVSLGINAAVSSPFNSLTRPQFGGHLGYNYLLIVKRKRFFGIKENSRDEIKMGFGLHLTVLQNKEFFMTANYFNPFIGAKGKVFSLYLFNEIGIGVHRSPITIESPASLGFTASLEVLRLRFGKSPLNLHLTMNYRTSNSLLAKDQLMISFMGGLRYYIYKKK